ncbi:MAG: hypothetical protein Ct9H300mP14_15320 [Gammaproteobacteria bacterium]|nr:MAG: hypothetical protein Ct9H300mP14_15320 [Gammaproteobacteria bacterium]
MHWLDIRARDQLVAGMPPQVLVLDRLIIFQNRPFSGAMSRAASISEPMMVSFGGVCVTVWVFGTCRDSFSLYLNDGIVVTIILISSLI